MDRPRFQASKSQFSPPETSGKRRFAGMYNGGHPVQHAKFVLSGQPAMFKRPIPPVRKMVHSKRKASTRSSSCRSRSPNAAAFPHRPGAAPHLEVDGAYDCHRIIYLFNRKEFWVNGTARKLDAHVARSTAVSTFTKEKGVLKAS